MKSHKFADIFPMMNEDDFNNLKKDIKEKGFDKNRPIILYEGEILDGRNRYQACQELDIKPIFIDYNGNDPLYYVISNNLNRRHLNESQRSIAGMKYKEYYSALHPQGKHHVDSSPPDKARDRAGEIVHVSGRLIDRAEYIQEKAPEIIQQIERGETTVGKAYGDLKRAEAETPEWLRYLDVWSFKENTGEGISNLPPEIIKNLLYYYTEKGDLVYDPFAGSGQTYKICKEMKRQCVCSDINPREDFIIRWDVDNGFKNFPESLDNCKLIFLDPPYFDMVEYGDGWSKTTLKEFYAKFEGFVRHLKGILKDDGYIALIIMPVERDGRYIDLGFECYNILKNNGFIIEQRLCVPLLKNWALDVRLKKSKENKEILTSSLRDLIIFKKEVK